MSEFSSSFRLFTIFLVTFLFQPTISAFGLGSSVTPLTYPISISSITALTAAFNSSSFSADISLSGGDAGKAVTDPNFSGFPSSLFTKNWIGLAIDNLTASFEIAFNVYDPDGSGTASYSHSFYSKNGKVGDIPVSVEFEVFGELYNVTEAISFTKPAAIIAQYSLASLSSFVHSDDIFNTTLANITIVFDGLDSNTNSLNFTPSFSSSQNNLNFDFTLGVRTIFTAGEGSFTIGTVNVDLPSYNISVSQVQNVLADCSTPAPSLNDVIFPQLTQITQTVQADINVETLDDTSNYTMGPWELGTVENQCLGYFTQRRELGIVPASPSDLTTGGSSGRSPGAKAGISIGVIAIIALLGTAIWYFCLRKRRSSTPLPTNSPSSSRRRGNKGQAISAGLAGALAFMTFRNHRRNKFGAEKNGKSDGWNQPAYEGAPTEPRPMDDLQPVTKTTTKVARKTLPVLDPPNLDEFAYDSRENLSRLPESVEDTGYHSTMLR